MFVLSIHNSKFVIHLVQFIKSKPIIGQMKTMYKKKNDNDKNKNNEKKTYAYENMLNVFKITLTVRWSIRYACVLFLLSFLLLCVFVCVAQVNRFEWTVLAWNLFNALAKSKHNNERNKRIKRKNDTNSILYFHVFSLKYSFSFRKNGQEIFSVLINLQMCWKYHVNMQINLILKIDWHRARERGFSFRFFYVPALCAHAHKSVFDFILMRICKILYEIHVYW